MSDALIGAYADGRNPAQWHSPSSSRPPRPLKRRERAAVVARIQALMEFWGFTLEELRDLSTTLPPDPPPAPIKYRHPVSGLTWDGEGAHPQWLRDALLKEGMRVDELKPEYQAAHA
jgi:DNA-binding protein H-NS